MLLVATTDQTAQDAQRTWQATDPPGADPTTELAGVEHWRGRKPSRSARGRRGARCPGRLAPDPIHLLQTWGGAVLIKFCRVDTAGA